MDFTQLDLHVVSGIPFKLFIQFKDEDDEKVDVSELVMTCAARQSGIIHKGTVTAIDSGFSLEFPFLKKGNAVWDCLLISQYVTIPLLGGDITVVDRNSATEEIPSTMQIGLSYPISTEERVVIKSITSPALDGLVAEAKQYSDSAKDSAEQAKEYADTANNAVQGIDDRIKEHNLSKDAHSALLAEKLTVPEGGLPGQVLVKTEDGQKWGENAGTTIDGVSGEINLSDGLEIDSETKTMGIGNAAVQSLTIADGGITQDIDVPLGGKAFFIGKNTTPVTGSNYYFAYQFSHGGAYLQAKRIDIGGRIYNATVAIMGDVNFFDGRVNISDRATSFTCHSPTATFASATTFNGTTIFNNDVTRKTKLSPLAEDVMNKQMVDTAIADAGGHTAIDGVAGDILLSDGLTMNPETKTLGLGDIVADSVNLSNADSSATINGSILSGSHGVNRIALLNEYGIGLISSVPEYNQLAIGGDKVLDMGYGRCVDRLSLLALGCGINLIPEGIFVNGAMWKGTSGGKGRYLASKENESVSGDWTFNANVIFNSSISNITGVYKTGKGTKICLGDYVQTPTVADAGKRFLEITNQSSASLATEFSTKVVTSTGSFSSETYSVFKDSFLEGNSITANVNLLVKGASTLRGVSTFNGAVIANAGLTNTTGTFLLPNKQNRFGQYVENPTIDDASKGWLMLEHSVNTGIDVTLYAEYVSSTGSVAGGQIRFGSAVVCNTSLLVFDNVDFRSTLRVGGNIRALAGNIVTPMSTTPTRIGDYVANPSTADAGKLWIEIAKKDGYIELSGKEVVNTDGTVSVHDYPVRIPGMIRYEELTEAEFAALPRPLPSDVIYRTTQN